MSNLLWDLQNNEALVAQLCSKADEAPEAQAASGAHNALPAVAYLPKQLERMTELTTPPINHPMLGYTSARGTTARAPAMRMGTASRTRTFAPELQLGSFTRTRSRAPAMEMGTWTRTRAAMPDAVMGGYTRTRGPVRPEPLMGGWTRTRITRLPAREDLRLGPGRPWRTTTIRVA